MGTVSDLDAPLAGVELSTGAANIKKHEDSTDCMFNASKMDPNAHFFVVPSTACEVWSAWGTRRTVDCIIMVEGALDMKEACRYCTFNDGKMDLGRAT